MRNLAGDDTIEKSVLIHNDDSKKPESVALHAAPGCSKSNILYLTHQVNIVFTNHMQPIMMS